MASIKYWVNTVYIWIIFNFVSGLSLAVLDTYFLLGYHQLPNSFWKLRVPMLSIYAVVLLLFVNSIVGWKGAIKNHGGALRSFSGIMFLSFVLELGLSVWCFLSTELPVKSVTMLFEDTFHVDSDGTTWWDVMQDKLDCCGVTGPYDYKAKGHVPFSCCVDLENTSMCSYIKQTGCAEAFTDQINNQNLMLSCLLLAVSILQFPAIFLSWCSANRIATNRNTAINYGKIELKPLNNEKL